MIDLDKLDSEAPDAETAPIGVIDLDKLDSEALDASSRHLMLFGLEPYKDLETLGTAGTEDKLTSEELTSLHIAMLQTDFHYRGSDNDAAPGFQDEKVQTQPRKSGTSASAKYVPSQSLSGPQELRDLEFVLYNSNEYYGYFPGVRQNSSKDSFMLSSRQQGQAKDFYARHWLAIRLLSKSSTKMKIAAAELLNEIHNQVGPILFENHPHFLPWISFVVCFPGNSPYSIELQNATLNLVSAISGIVLGLNDPRWRIQQCLATSKFRRDICLAMLRQVIAIFRQQIQESHLHTLELLARLFDNIEALDNFDESAVEKTLQSWAENSLTIAEIIKTEREIERRRRAA